LTEAHPLQLFGTWVVAVELVLWVKPLLAQQVVMVAMELLQLSQARL
jgi:hypothetical protein